MKWVKGKKVNLPQICTPKMLIYIWLLIIFFCSAAVKLISSQTYTNSSLILTYQSLFLNFCNNKINLSSIILSLYFLITEE